MKRTVKLYPNKCLILNRGLAFVLKINNSNMKIIKTNNFPFGRYTTINICGIIFTKRDKLNNTTITHEAIHSKQIFELLIIFFYLWYVIEFIIRYISNGLKWHEAYRAICFEKEAYVNQDNLMYINKRKRYSFLNYLK